MNRNAVFYFVFFAVSQTAVSQNVMYLGGVNAAGHQSHRLVVQEPLGKKWQTTVFAQSLEGVRHGIIGFGPTYKLKGFDINPMIGVAAGSNRGNHGFTPSIVVFKETSKWLVDLQGIYLAGRGRNNHGLLIGPIDSVWQVSKNFRLGVTGQVGHWQGHMTANIGPEGRLRITEKIWLTGDIKPTQLMVGGHGKKHIETGFGFVWDLTKSK